MDLDETLLTAAELAALVHRIRRPIVLVGMMGVGKSSVGKRLSAALDCPFIDADDEIEKAAQMTIAEILLSPSVLVRKTKGTSSTRSGRRADARISSRIL